ncbi:hypothetical protein HanIR_Chr03g0127641 [Helianthus annuus]|nr:hypothetical protein HanIR_Chr03g0127641 [Helianthus annuus]
MRRRTTAPPDSPHLHPPRHLRHSHRLTLYRHRQFLRFRVRHDSPQRRRFRGDYRRDR